MLQLFREALAATAVLHGRAEMKRGNNRFVAVDQQVIFVAVVQIERRTSDVSTIDHVLNSDRSIFALPDQVDERLLKQSTGALYSPVCPHHVASLNAAVHSMNGRHVAGGISEQFTTSVHLRTSLAFCILRRSETHSSF